MKAIIRPLAIFLIAPFFAACIELSDAECYGDEHENLPACKNAEPGGCGNKPKPTYKNTTCDESEFSDGDYESQTFTWCCLEGDYISETWVKKDGCWEKETSYKGEGICR